jgi:hypothetical protein
MEYVHKKLMVSNVPQAYNPATCPTELKIQFSEIILVNVFDVKLMRFKIKILKIICGHIGIDSTWRITTKEKLDNLIEYKNKVHFIKARRQCLRREMLTKYINGS